MILRFIKKSLILIFLFSFSGVFAEPALSIDYYGIASRDADRNMVSMTEDLYYTQLKEMNLNLTDSRNDSFSTDYFIDESAVFSGSDSSNSVFYVVISRLPSSKWECSINLKNLSNQKINSYTKEYDSYYKIMMESKSVLNEIFSGLINPESAETKKSADNSALTTEMLSGTWTGEDFNKIVIMRGGRGFAIFKNGASMNISLKIENDENGKQFVSITQTSGNNASYFPEIDRKSAMELAINAEPVTWKMNFSDNKLSGTKNTFIQNGTEIKWASVEVQWTRSN